MKREALSSVQAETDSQCSERRMGVMCSYLRTFIRIPAALFWMYCSFLDAFAGDPYEKCVVVIHPGVDKGVDKFLDDIREGEGGMGLEMFLRW